MSRAIGLQLESCRTLTWDPGLWLDTLSLSVATDFLTLSSVFDILDDTQNTINCDLHLAFLANLDYSMF